MPVPPPVTSATERSWGSLTPDGPPLACGSLRGRSAALLAGARTPLACGSLRGRSAALPSTGRPGDVLAAVGADDRAVDPGGLVAAEEVDHVGDVGRPREAAEGVAQARLRLQVGRARDRGERRRLGDPGLHDVAADPEGRVLDG